MKRPRSANGTRRERLSYTKTVVSKIVKGHAYLYWRWWEGGRYRSKYIGKPDQEAQHATHKDSSGECDANR
jgi:hypothetical protein